jgi:hypothetical protein
MVKTVSMFEAKDIAEYFVHLVDQESGDNITNLILRKLLYLLVKYFSTLVHAGMHNQAARRASTRAQLGSKVGFARLTDMIGGHCISHCIDYPVDTL